jgi:hypothetical protein
MSVLFPRSAALWQIMLERTKPLVPAGVNGARSGVLNDLRVVRSVAARRRQPLPRRTSRLGGNGVPSVARSGRPNDHRSTGEKACRTAAGSRGERGAIPTRSGPSRSARHEKLVGSVSRNAAVIVRRLPFPLVPMAVRTNQSRLRQHRAVSRGGGVVVQRYRRVRRLRTRTPRRRRTPRNPSRRSGGDERNLRLLRKKTFQSVRRRSAGATDCVSLVAH